MNLLQRLKAVFDSSKVQAASGRSMIVGGDAMRAPFDLRAGVKAYNSWIYAAANLNAVAVASTPLRLYIRKRSNRTKLWQTKEVSRATKAYLSGRARQTPSHCVMRKSASIGDNYEEVVDSHPLLELLANVNPYQNGFDASVLRTLFGELTGNAFIHPVMDKRLGIPVELWTLPSQYVEIIPGKKSFIDGYMYGVDRQNRKRFEVDEVIHFKRPNPDDMYWGKGKVEAAFFAEQMNQAVHMMDLKFFQNNARPDSLVSIKGGASEADIRAFEAALSAKLEGSRNAGRFIVATAEIDIKPLSFPPKDLGGRDEIIEEIAAVFGVPVSMLKANDPNLASAKTGFSSWRETTILPLLRMDEEQLNQSLVPMFDLQGDAVLAYDNPVIEDEVIELQSRQSAVAGGWMTANEARIEEGREPMDDPAADQLMYGGRPLGFVAPPPPPPMAQMASMPMNQAAIDTTPSDSIPVDQVEPVAPMIETPTKSARAMKCCGECGTWHEKIESASAMWAKSFSKSASSEFLAITEDEAAIASAVDKVLRKQIAEVLKEVEAATVATPELAAKVASMLRGNRWQKEISSAMKPYLATALKQGIDVGMKTIKEMATAAPNFTPATPELDAYTASESVRLSRGAADGVNQYTSVRVSEIIGNGVAEGKTIPEIAATVQDWAGEAGDTERGTYTRSVMIARTEAQRASRSAEVEAWKSSGLVEGKTWLLAPDPCEFCQAASDAFSTNSVGLGESFYAKDSTLTGADGGSMMLDYEAIDGPPLHPNCRCSMQPTLSADYADIAAELDAAVAADSGPYRG